MCFYPGCRLENTIKIRFYRVKYFQGDTSVASNRLFVTFSNFIYL